MVKIALLANFESKYLYQYNTHIHQIFKNCILPVASDDVYNYQVPAVHSFCAISDRREASRLASSEEDGTRRTGSPHHAFARSAL